MSLKKDKSLRKGERTINIETNGGHLRTFKSRCLKGICGEIIDVEEIGYINGIMHVRCLKCGYVLHNEELPLS